MGRRGPAPKPTQLRVLEGLSKGGRSAVAHRSVPANEPQPAAGAACPPWLPAEAKAYWRKLAPRLLRTHLLTELDAEALGNLCLVLAQLKAAQAVLDAKGFTVTTPSGYKQQRPEVAIVKASLYLARQYFAEFGMTPSARARISLPDEGGEEDSAGILS
jgi:P27 family predicted phage terminase small subunit